MKIMGLLDEDRVPGVVYMIISILATLSWHHYKNCDESSQNIERKGYDQLVGHTQLIELKAISSILRRKLFVKMESSNPGGTAKDRAVQHMLDEAEKVRRLKPGMTVFEGTSGSTGIALAFQCLARGYKLHVVMPDDQAEEKRSLLRKLGAEVTVVPSCAIANKDHYVNTARRLASECNGYFVDQFENIDNWEGHYKQTAVEIWQQTRGNLDAFVMSSGTGGTIAGVSKYMKERKPAIRIVLADPTGSSLCNKVRHNVCYTVEQAERKVKKHRYDSIVEGVGLDRVTANFSQALIDEANKAKDQDILNMAHALLHLEGLFVGSSSALNLTVACRVAKTLPEDSAVLTIICDNGSRHLSRFWNEEFIASAGLQWPVNTTHDSNRYWQDIIFNS